MMRVRSGLLAAVMMFVIKADPVTNYGAFHAAVYKQVKRGNTTAHVIHQVLCGVTRDERVGRKFGIFTFGPGQHFVTIGGGGYKYRVAVMTAPVGSDAFTTVADESGEF